MPFNSTVGGSIANAKSPLLPPLDSVQCFMHFTGECAGLYKIAICIFKKKFNFTPPGVIMRYDLKCHQDADDTKFYLSASPQNPRDSGGYPKPWLGGDNGVDGDGQAEAKSWQGGGESIIGQPVLNGLAFFL